MASSTIYSCTTYSDYSNYNDGDNYWYAFQFVATATGIPKIIQFGVESGGAGTGDSVYIRDQQSASSANYGYATGVAWSSGAGYQTIQLVGGSEIIAGNTYYVCVKITVAANHPHFRYDRAKTNYTQTRSASANADPTTLVRTFDMQMTILGNGLTLGEYLGAGSATTKLLLHLNGSSADSSGNGNNGTDTNVTYV